MDTVRILGCRVDDDSFVVQRIKTMDRLVSKPLAFETEAAEGVSVQYLHLVKIRPSSKSTFASSSRDTDRYHTLTYSYDDEHKTAGPKMQQPSLADYKPTNVMEIEKKAILMEAERLLKEIVGELDGERFYADPSGKFVGEKIDMLRNTFAHLDKKELSDFCSRFLGQDKWSTIK